MLTVVIYDSKFGNTEKIAQAIARGAGTHGAVRLVHTSQAAQAVAQEPDLLIVGGPTQRRNMSPELSTFFEGVQRGSLAGVRTAAFDTRYRGSTLIMGSAAREAGKRLEGAGGHLLAPPESFFMGRGGRLEDQSLEPGEIDRAEAWGRAAGSAALAGRSPALAGRSA